MKGRHQHFWIELLRREPHAFGRPVQYVRCAICFQMGFRFPGRRVVYTWSK